MPPLAGPRMRAVLHAIAFKADDLAGVHADRHADAENALRIFDHCPDVVVEFQRVCRQVEILQCDFICVLLELLRLLTWQTSIRRFRLGKVFSSRMVVPITHHVKGVLLIGSMATFHSRGCEVEFLEEIVLGHGLRPQRSGEQKNNSFTTSRLSPRAACWILKAEKPCCTTTTSSTASLPLHRHGAHHLRESLDRRGHLHRAGEHRRRHGSRHRGGRRSPEVLGQASRHPARPGVARDRRQNPRARGAARPPDHRRAGQNARTGARGSGLHRRLHGLHGRVGAPHRRRDPGKRPARRNHPALPPADRRHRRNSALELPLLPDRAQGGARAGHRQHHRHQAQRGDAAQCREVLRADGADRSAAGRDQHRPRPRRRGGEDALRLTRRSA